MKQIFHKRPVLGLFVINGAMGAGLGVLLASALVYGDVNGLQVMMAQSVGIFAGWAMLSYAFACTFAALAMATAIMLHWGREEKDGSGGGLSIPADNRLQRVPAYARSRRPVSGSTRSPQNDRE